MNRLSDQQAEDLARRIFGTLRARLGEEDDDERDRVDWLERVFVAGFLMGNDPQRLLETELGHLYLEV